MNSFYTLICPSHRRILLVFDTMDRYFMSQNAGITNIWNYEEGEKEREKISVSQINSSV